MQLPKDNSALLNWTVENRDANSSHFAIERSNNGINFNQIGIVNALTDHNHLIHIQIMAFNLSGTVYYRLKMVDKDGQFAYSDIKLFNLPMQDLLLRIYPNPVQSMTKLNITLDQAQVIKVSVNDALGKSVKQMEINRPKRNE